GIAIAPHRPELHFDLGVVYESQHKYDLAAEQYKAALAAAPDNAQARQQLAAMQARLSQPGQNQQSPGPAYR
ncbi:MAG: tetratricopeptide repeat protein, partial [Candidatus Eremiobacteraeota bacterium]|nr:tetratricopeptide repeat protein [Candidatus Eremiobacteraeota bacterium]